MQTRGMVADISERQVEIGFELDLIFQVPRVHHRRTSEARRDVVPSLAIRLRRVEVRSARQHGQPRIDLWTGKRISCKQSLIGGESLQRSLAEVGVNQRPI